MGDLYRKETATVLEARDDQHVHLMGQGGKVDFRNTVKGEAT